MVVATRRTVTMHEFRKTPVAARMLGISFSRLHSLIRSGKIAAPQKDTSGDFLWSDEDLASARKTLAASRALAAADREAATS
jgi:hypothetical protein